MGRTLKVKRKTLGTKAEYKKAVSEAESVRNNTKYCIISTTSSDDKILTYSLVIYVNVFISRFPNGLSDNMNLYQLFRLYSPRNYSDHEKIAISPHVVTKMIPNKF